MRDRLTAAIIFAVFGALATVVLALMIDAITAGDEEINVNPAAMPGVAALAAFSAGLCAACVGRHLISHPVPIGMLTMLAAQVPFSILAVAFGLIGTTGATIGEILPLLVTFLIGGWLVAGIFQITTGAIAGLLVRHFLKRNPT